jgi:hypothetical protein
MKIGPVQLGSNGDTGLSESERAIQIENELLRETVGQLEQAFEETGWRQLGAGIAAEFTRQGLTDLINVARMMYLSHPLIKRAINVTSYYVWGQGVSIAASDDAITSMVVEPLMEDDYNRVELFSQSALLGTEVDQMCDGNVFMAMFTDGEGNVSLRSVPTEQMVEIITKEGDGRVVTFYRRRWVERVLDPATGETKDTEKEALYPDWRWRPSSQPARMGDVEVMWDAPIIHDKTGGLKRMAYGMPEVYAAMPWSRSYKEYLEDWHTIVKALARFAWKGKTKSRKGAKRLREKLQSKTAAGELDELPDSNPPPAAGSVAIMSEYDDLTPMPKSGAITKADDARASRLMVAAAVDLPDTILSGDVDIGNFATSKTLDRPTELRMRNRQMLKAEFLEDIFRYVIDTKIRAGKLAGGEQEDERTGLKVVKSTVDDSIEISFPPILEHDKEANVGAIVTAATLGGKSSAEVLPAELVSKMLLQALDVEDVEEAMKELPEQEASEVAEALGRLEEAIRARS